MDALITIAAVLGLAFLMNYCGATATLGLAFAATAVFFRSLARYLDASAFLSRAAIPLATHCLEIYKW